MVNIKKNIFIALFTALYFFGVAMPGSSHVTEASFFDFIRAFVTINPLAIDVSVPTEVEIAKNFKVDVVVINKGDVKIENTKGEIFLPAELSLLGKDTPKNIGAVRGGRQKKFSWSVKGESPGNYIVIVSVSGTVSGDPVNVEESTSVITVVKKTPPPRRSSNIFINLFNRLQKLFQPGPK